MKRMGIQSLACCLGIAVGLAVLAAQAAPPAADAEGFRPLFDGKTLDGWDGDPKLWHVEDGCITGQTTKENPASYNTFLIWRGGKPGDFQLKVEFRMPNPGFANSGVQIRSWEGSKPWQVFGYQPDMDSDDNYTGTCYGENFRGGLAGRGEKVTIGKDGKRTVERFASAAELAKFIKNRAWNEYDITAQGNRIVEKINGHLMCELVDEDKVARKDGVIAFQIHAGPPMKVQFRNIRFKELKHDNPMKAEAKKKIVFLAGGPSHGYAQHEHHAGCLLLAKCIQENVPEAETVVYQGWPQPGVRGAPPHALDDAATVVIFCDGGGGHIVMNHLDELDKLMHKGVGMACIHYAVEVPKGKAGDLMKSWIGGYFEEFWSVNPRLESQLSRVPRPPRSPRPPPLHGQRRVVLSHAFSGRHEGCDADPDCGPARRRTPLGQRRPRGQSARLRPQGPARAHGLGLPAAGRRPRLRHHRRPLPLELGLRWFPHRGAQRHRLDGRAGSARRRRALEDADLRRAAQEPR